MKGAIANTYLRNHDILARFEQYKKDGLSEAEIAKRFGYFMVDKNGNLLHDDDGNELPSISLLRATVDIAKNYVKEKIIFEVKDMSKHGMTNAEIAEKTGYKESTVKSMLKVEYPDLSEKIFGKKNETTKGIY